MLSKIKFIFAVILLFFVLSCLGPLVSLITLKPSRAQLLWSSYCARALRLNFRYLPQSQKVQSARRTLVLLNHRTQGDFFVHELITDSTCNFLARLMVAIIFPFLGIFSQVFTQAVWFFRRGGNNLEKFFQWIDWKFDHCQRPNLLVYPEGHRMSDAGKPAPLKKGMIQYAYERKLDVQIAIAFGTEQAFNEKKLHVSFGPTTITCFVDFPIASTNFQSFDQFHAAVEKRFQELFVQVYEAHYKRN